MGVVIISTACEEHGARSTASTPPPQATPPAITLPEAQKSAEPALAAQAAPQPQESDPVPGIIAGAEREYQKGQANYQAGHLDAAKVNFDNAFDILLQSKVGVHDDDRLENEFDKIVEGVHQIEMQALKEGDGFTEQKSEPAPIDEANDITFPVDPNVRAKAEEELRNTRSDLPLMMNDQVASFINYFSSRGKGTLERGLARSGRYRDMIQSVLKQEGVPRDLIYLAQAESGFHPLALSRAGARGMWQFMGSRASGYGLERNWWVDDRQDPEKATRAAARHLKDLYNQFGDWYLAMAAYNSGPGTVQRAVQRTGYADFWELYRRGVLPKETKNYVPIIIAVTIMAKNPAQYGLQDVVPDQPPAVDKVKIDYPVDLRLVAECTDAPLATLQDLNPSLLRMTTPRGEDFVLNLPAGTADRFEKSIASIPQDKRTFWRYHKVQSGETLTEIARRYRTTAKDIAEVNNLQPQTELEKDARLVIPVTPGRQGEQTTYSKRPTRYKVRKGDTVLSVADDFGVPVERLRKWNHLRGNALRHGRTLVIYRPIGSEPQFETARARKSGKKATASTRLKRVSESETETKPTAKPKKTKRPPAADAPKRHTVKRGETLTSIAETYNTTVTQLRKDNKNISSEIRPGQVVIIK